MAVKLKATAVGEAATGSAAPAVGCMTGLRQARPMAWRCLLAVTLPSAALCVLSGCRVLIGATAAAVVGVGLVGYGVYKTGEVAVTGVGSVVSGVTRGGGSVVFMNGEFKAKCEGPVEAVWLAAGNTLKANGFELVAGKRDALSGHLEASLSNGEPIAIKLEAAGPAQTEIRIRIGAEGNLKKSETLYALVTLELDRQREQQRQRNL